MQVLSLSSVAIHLANMRHENSLNQIWNLTTYRQSDIDAILCRSFSYSIQNVPRKHYKKLDVLKNDETLHNY